MQCNFLKTSLAVALALPLLFSPTASADEDLGEKLIREFFSDSKSRNLPAIEWTLSEVFQLCFRI